MAWERSRPQPQNASLVTAPTTEAEMGQMLFRVKRPWGGGGLLQPGGYFEGGRWHKRCVYAGCYFRGDARVRLFMRESSTWERGHQRIWGAGSDFFEQGGKGGGSEGRRGEGGSVFQKHFQTTWAPPPLYVRSGTNVGTANFRK